MFLVAASVLLGFLLRAVSCDSSLVAFNLGQNTHLQLSNATTIPFSKVITAHRTSGQLSSGVFTCQTAGLYRFQVYSLTQTDSSLLLQLYHNDAVVASLWAHTPTNYAAAGNAAILNLAAGDTVQVKSSSATNVSTFGTEHQIYTTFTGESLREYQYAGAYQRHAFFLSLDQHQSVPGGTNVRYNKVVTDTAFAYNTNSGTYVVPAEGIYMIQLFGLARKNEELWLELFQNSDYVCSVYGKTDQERADAGNTVILHLRPGDQLQVRARPGYNNSLYGTPQEIYTTLSGYQLVGDHEIGTTLNSPGSKAYFSAGLSKGYTVADGDKVVFDRIFTDLGVYDHQTGEFTAPYFGTYEFVYHALSEQSNEIWLELYHNYRYIDSLYAHTPGSWAGAGNAAIIEMDQGDVVYVRVRGSNSLFGTFDQIYCTFSGILLSPRFNKNPSVVGK